MTTPEPAARAAASAAAPTPDASSMLLLAAAFAVAALYIADALWLHAGDTAARVWASVSCVLLALPARAAWRRRGRAGFWYAILSTLFVAHAVSLAASPQASRAFALALLAAALSLFVLGCGHTRRHGLTQA